MKAHVYSRGTVNITVPLSEKLLAALIYPLRVRHGFGTQRAYKFFEAFEYNFIKIGGEVARGKNEYTKDTLQYLADHDIHIAHIQEESMRDFKNGKYKFNLDKGTIADIAMLRTLSENFGWGRERCRKFYGEINEVAEEMRNKYRSGKDDGHYEVMLSRLRYDGIDIKKWISEMGV